MRLIQTNLLLKPSKRCEGFASYIDMLQSRSGPPGFLRVPRALGARLTDRSAKDFLPNGRVDLVIRPAGTDSFPGYGLTLYAAGCGADAPTAYSAWEAVLRAAVTATINSDSSASLTGE